MIHFWTYRDPRVSFARVAHALARELSDRLVDRADLMSAARGLVETATGSDPNHLAALKSLIREAQS